MTRVEEQLEQRNLVVLADAGYTASDRVFVISDLPRNSSLGLRRQHAGQRSVVEQCFSHVQSWRAADAQFIHTPELQEMSLMVIYSLVQLKHAFSAARPGRRAFPADT